jgi:hypothetical protein
VKYRESLPPMSDLIREPIGLRVLVRALRPEDREPFLFWRDAPLPEADALIETGADETPAVLWAALLRWREAEAVAHELSSQGWEVKLQGVRAIALTQAITILQPPSQEQGWTLTVGDLALRAVPESPGEDPEALQRLLAFLDEGK